jgi:hypothetical protein
VRNRKTTCDTKLAGTPHRAKNSSHKTCAISRVVYRCTRTRYVDVIESVKVEEDDWQVESGLR